MIGVAWQGQAADVLQREAGIPSQTAALLLRRIERGEDEAIPSHSAVVVDEASVMPTRALERLVHAAAWRSARLVLVGDRAQLPSIDAGGGFAALADRLGAVEEARASFGRAAKHYRGVSGAEFLRAWDTREYGLDPTLGRASWNSPCSSNEPDRPALSEPGARKPGRGRPGVPGPLAARVPSKVCMRLYQMQLPSHTCLPMAVRFLPRSRQSLRRSSSIRPTDH